jgi:hypothetical protein
MNVRAFARAATPWLFVAMFVPACERSTEPGGVPVPRTDTAVTDVAQDVAPAPTDAPDGAQFDAAVDAPTDERADTATQAGPAFNETVLRATHNSYSGGARGSIVPTAISRDSMPCSRRRSAPSSFARRISERHGPRSMRCAAACSV